MTWEPRYFPTGEGNGKNDYRDYNALVAFYKGFTANGTFEAA